ncbi:RNA methyltransferase, TrmH family [Selenomonas sp. GACV-9]|uniref:TrmH family RNA methyltransferase n=1 Tax=Selenomonas sp. GACV-9 TaxID=3158782 RepID=UPI0008EDAA48|nr:RNA methyltransferase, TrmH family [Selenomonas ruminantium]
MRERIDSPANKKIKLAASLHSRKHREKEGLFVAEGIRLVEMAAAAGWGIAFALYTAELSAQPRGQQLLAQLEAQGCLLCETSEAVYRKASATDTPQGILLVMRQQKSRLAELPAADKPLYVILDGVQDPGNAGTIIRTADAVGADGVILLKGSVDVFGDKIVRSTMGSLFHLPVCTDVTVEELAAFTAERGLALYATALDESAKPHFAQDFTRGAAIVFGNEGNGVSQELLQQAQKTYIPMYGQAESLNVGVSAAVVLYEAVRQRRA